MFVVLCRWLYIVVDWTKGMRRRWLRTRTATATVSSSTTPLRPRPRLSLAYQPQVNLIILKLTISYLYYVHRPSPSFASVSTVKQKRQKQKRKAFINLSGCFGCAGIRKTCRKNEMNVSPIPWHLLRRFIFSVVLFFFIRSHSLIGTDRRIHNRRFFAAASVHPETGQIFIVIESTDRIRDPTKQWLLKEMWKCVWCWNRWHGTVYFILFQSVLFCKQTRY